MNYLSFIDIRRPRGVRLRSRGKSVLRQIAYQNTRAVLCHARRTIWPPPALLVTHRGIEYRDTRVLAKLYPKLYPMVQIVLLSSALSMRSGSDIPGGMQPCMGITMHTLEQQGNTTGPIFAWTAPCSSISIVLVLFFCQLRQILPPHFIIILKAYICRASYLVAGE